MLPMKVAFYYLKNDKEIVNFQNFA